MTSLFCVSAYCTHILPGWEAGMGDSSGVIIYASITFHLKDIFFQVLFVYCKIPKVGIFLANSLYKWPGLPNYTHLTTSYINLWIGRYNTRII